MNFSDKTIIVISPHADDDIIGCGGVIHKSSRLGGKVIVAVINMEEPHRSGEEERALSDLPNPAIIETFGYYPNGIDTLSIKDISLWIEKNIEKYKPDIIFVPEDGVTHQDHRACYEAAMIACRPSSGTSRHIPKIVLAYESVADIWPSRSAISPQFYIKLSKKDISFKSEAIKKHTSQYRNYPSERSSESITALAMIRGSQSGYEYAEAYRVVRFVAE